MHRPRLIGQGLLVPKPAPQLLSQVGSIRRQQQHERLKCSTGPARTTHALRGQEGEGEGEGHPCQCKRVIGTLHQKDITRMERLKSISSKA